MTTLALDVTIDSSGATQGAAEAKRALDDIYGSAAKVLPQVEAVNKSLVNTRAALGNAFQATGGSIQIAQGINQTADAFGRLNVSSALFSTSRVLLEIGKTTQDFREMRTAIGGASGAMGLLSAAWKSSPIGVIATAIGVAAAAMSLFSGKTAEAADAWSKLGTSMRNAQLDEGIAQSLGISTAGALSSQSSGVLDALRQASGPNAAPVGIGAFAAASGIDQSLILNQLAASGNEQALEYVRTGYYTRSIPGLGDPYEPNTERIRAAPNISLSPSQQIDLLRRQYRTIGERARDSQNYTRFDAPTYGPEEFNPYSDDPYDGSRKYGPEQPPGYEQEYNEAIRRQVEAANQIANVFESIGANIGGVAADLLFGATTFKSAIASIVRGTATSALQGVGAGIVGAFGRTLAQGNNDAGVIPPGGPR